MSEPEPTDPESEQIAHDRALAEWWEQEAARQDELGRLLKEAGRLCPMPTKDESEAEYLRLPATE